MRTTWPLVGVLITVVALGATACGDVVRAPAGPGGTGQLSASGPGRNVVSGTGAPVEVYDGPLDAHTEDRRAAPRRERYGAAGLALDCRTPAAIRGGLYDAPRYEGEASDDPAGAMDAGVGAGAYWGATHDYRLVRRTDTRALFVHLVDGRVKEAVIVHDGPTVEGKGWHVEAWARCDWSEFPDDVPGAWGIQIWVGETGQRVPTTRVKSFADACDQDGMTELVVGRRHYLGGSPPSLRDWLAEAPRHDVSVPGDAVDTGYHRGDRHLWLSADDQRAYVGSRAGVDVWPRLAKPLICG
jgi:hypothetical protein